MRSVSNRVTAQGRAVRDLMVVGEALTGEKQANITNRNISSL